MEALQYSLPGNISYIARAIARDIAYYKAIFNYKGYFLQTTNNPQQLEKVC
jgi:hypothetical protein